MKFLPFALSIIFLCLARFSFFFALWDLLGCEWISNNRQASSFFLLPKRKCYFLSPWRCYLFCAQRTRSSISFMPWVQEWSASSVFLSICLITIYLLTCNTWFVYRTKLNAFILKNPPTHRWLSHTILWMRTILWSWSYSGDWNERGRNWSSCHSTLLFWIILILSLYTHSPRYGVFTAPPHCTTLHCTVPQRHGG